MITTTDVGNIIYRDCKIFGVEVYQDGNVDDGPVEVERIVIHPKELSSESVWRKCFVEVNFFVPDIRGKADLRRLNDVERTMFRTLVKTSRYDDICYSYSPTTIGVFASADEKAHYVNAKILFRAMNVIE